MPDEIEEIVEDSIGATEAEEAVDTSTVIEGDEDTSAAIEGEESDLPEEVYYDIDGEEVSAADIKKWKSGHMKDADYTQKKQALSESQKAVKAQQAQLADGLNMLAEMESEIESLALGDLKNVDLDELLANEDTAEYLKVKGQMEKRGKVLESLKAKHAKLKSELGNEAAKQIAESLGWQDEAKRKSDIDAITSYAKDVGITDHEFERVTSPKVMEAILKAAKYDKLMANKPNVMKRVVKAPKVSKPSKSNSKPNLKPWEEVYGTD